MARLAEDSRCLRILGKYAPAIAGIAGSGDIEMGAVSIGEIFKRTYLPFEPQQLDIAINEIFELMAST